MNKSIVIPGEKVGDANQFQAGFGVYEKNGELFASLVGKRMIQKSNTENEKSIVSIHSNKDKPITPTVGAKVLCKVLRINARYATTSILCVDDLPLKESFQGIIRLQDVDLLTSEDTLLYDCFRPGDIVLADVLSLGDKRNFYLTTGGVDRGVVFAKSSQGIVLKAVSKTTMICPQTQSIEQRKVATINNNQMAID